MRKADIARFVEQFDRLGTTDGDDTFDEVSVAGAAMAGNSGNDRERYLRQRSNSNLKNLMQKMSADMSGMFTVKK